MDLLNPLYQLGWYPWCNFLFFILISLWMNLAFSELLLWNSTTYIQISKLIPFTFSFLEAILTDYVCLFRSPIFFTWTLYVACHVITSFSLRSFQGQCGNKHSLGNESSLLIDLPKLEIRESDFRKVSFTECLVPHPSNEMHTLNTFAQNTC